jgi:hypothetical protein
MASVQSWTGSRPRCGRTRRVIRVWSSKDSSQFLRTDSRRGWVCLSGRVETDGRSLSDTDIIQAERSLYRVRQDMVAKREEMSRISIHQEPSGSGGWMGKVFGSKADQGMYQEVVQSGVDADEARSGITSSRDGWFESYGKSGREVTIGNEDQEGTFVF